MSNKKKKIISIITISCFILLIIELIMFAGYRFMSERRLNRINSITDVLIDNNNYIAVGMSDFHNSRFISEDYYDYVDETTKEKSRIITTQARIAKYDQNLKIIWENSIKNKYDSMFNSVLQDDDGYVAVGSFISSQEQIANNTRTAMIVKYDNNGKQLWKKNYKVLSDTRFYKVIKDGNDYVVIGQSIYENMEVGSHTTGGGIIVRYNKDGEELAHNNYGGNKSGSFNDIIDVGDGFIICGKDAANYGIVIKISKDFGRLENDHGLISNKIIWNKTFSNTDNQGFTSMVLVNNTIYTVGALNVSNEKDDNDKTIFKYDAGLAMYDLTGKYLGSGTIKNDTHHRFNSVVFKDNSLFLSLLLDVDSYYDGRKQNSVLYEYDLAKSSFNKIEEITSERDYIINRLLIINNDLFYVGTTNDHCTIRGCDYEPIISNYKKK